MVAQYVFHARFQMNLKHHFEVPFLKNPDQMQTISL